MSSGVRIEFTGTLTSLIAGPGTPSSGGGGAGVGLGLGLSSSGGGGGVHHHLSPQKQHLQYVNKDTRPPNYVRSSGGMAAVPTSTAPSGPVEYDMDEADSAWLAMVNAQRVASNQQEVTPDVFELLIDHLEKDWFTTNKARRAALFAQADEPPCAVCGEDDVDAANALVFCDGCNLSVHQDCYGVPCIPEGAWLCRKCLIAPDRELSCALCPNKGGALKPTDDGRWVHVQCAMWIPEVSFANFTFLEPIDSIDKISKDRWRLACSICHKREGACIQCDKQGCFSAYHVVCAQRAGSVVEKLPNDRFRSYCTVHSHVNGKLSIGSDGTPFIVIKRRGRPPKVPRPQQTIALPALAAVKTKAMFENTQSVNTMTQHMVIPTEIYNRALAAVNNFGRKREFVALVCKYWTLKRLDRSGAPLLRRLAIDSAASSRAHTDGGNDVQSSSDQDGVLHDLTRVLQITELIVEREKKKYELLKIKRDIFSRVADPLGYVFERLLEIYRMADPNGFFSDPVDTKVVDDYLDVIQTPMDFSTMRRKLQAQEYDSLRAFEADAMLIPSNAMKYNQAKSVYYRAGQELQEAIDACHEQAKSVLDQIEVDKKTGWLKLSSRSNSEDRALLGALTVDARTPVPVLEHRAQPQAQQTYQWQTDFSLSSPQKGVKSAPKDKKRKREDVVAATSEDENAVGTPKRYSLRHEEEALLRLEESDIIIGLRVEGRWTDGLYYPGTVTFAYPLQPNMARHYHIMFDDNYEKDLPVSELRRLVVVYEPPRYEGSTPSTPSMEMQAKGKVQNELVFEEFFPPLTLTGRSSSTSSSETKKKQKVADPSKPPSRRGRPPKNLSLSLGSSPLMTTPPQTSATASPPNVAITSKKQSRSNSISGSSPVSTSPRLPGSPRKRFVEMSIPTMDLNGDSQSVNAPIISSRIPNGSDVADFKVPPPMAHVSAFSPGDLVFAKPKLHSWLPAIFVKFLSKSGSQTGRNKRPPVIVGIVELLTADPPNRPVLNVSLDKLEKLRPHDVHQMRSVMNRNKFTIRKTYETAYARAMGIVATGMDGVNHLQSTSAAILNSSVPQEGEETTIVTAAEMPSPNLNDDEEGDEDDEDQFLDPGTEELMPMEAATTMPMSLVMAPVPKGKAKAKGIVASRFEGAKALRAEQGVVDARGKGKGRAKGKEKSATESGKGKRVKQSPLPTTSASTSTPVSMLSGSPYHQHHPHHPHHPHQMLLSPQHHHYGPASPPMMLMASSPLHTSGLGGGTDAASMVATPGHLWEIWASDENGTLGEDY